MPAQQEALAVILPADAGLDWPAGRLSAAEHANALIYRPDQLDDVERAIRAGRVRRVALPSLEPLLEAIWEHEIDFEYWQRAGVRIELPADVAEASPEQRLGRLHASWRRWSTRRQRRNALFAMVLSALVVISATLWAARVLPAGSA